jgi:hypothetical protein
MGATCSKLSNGKAEFGSVLEFGQEPRNGRLLVDASATTIPSPTSLTVTPPRDPQTQTDEHPRQSAPLWATSSPTPARPHQTTLTQVTLRSPPAPFHSNHSKGNQLSSSNPLQAASGRLFANSREILVPVTGTSLFGDDESVRNSVSGALFRNPFD